MPERTRVTFGEESSGPEWVVTYHIGLLEFDDNIEDTETYEIVLNAPNFEFAVRYAQQYLRKMQNDEQTQDEWQDAEILSVELR